MNVAPRRDLRRRLKNCPAGAAGWKEFEDVCVETLSFLFIPPLKRPHLQSRSYSGIDRRDAVFPNWNVELGNNWGILRRELDARMVLFEFKNYHAAAVGKDEVNQTRNYLSKPLGRLAILCCNRLPNKAAHIKRNSIYSDDQKVILFLTTKHLIEMLTIKERGEDPSDLIMDLVERFYIQHE
jgi:hypothetical protein